MSSQNPPFPFPSGTTSSAPRRAENLAFLFQELLTVIARLRANRQPVQDPADFRTQITATLTTSSQEAVRRGYQTEDVKMAAYAVVALLDESVLNSGNSAFSDWLRNPLQAQLFGVMLAGDNYFRNVDNLLSRPDSQDLADVLEVYLLGLSLGFRGRHGQQPEYAASPSGSASGSGRATVRNMNQMIGDKIRRIRGQQGGLYVSLDQGPVMAAPARDLWRTRLIWAAAIGWILAIVLFLVFKLILGGMPSKIA